MKHTAISKKIFLTTGIILAMGFMLPLYPSLQTVSATEQHNEKNEVNHSAAREAIEQSEENLLGSKKHQELEVKEVKFHSTLRRYTRILFAKIYNAIC